MIKMIDIIEKKKQGLQLNKEEIHFFVNGAADGSIPDYQLAALLMAIRLNGMTDEETTQLTLAMTYSGDVCDLSEVPGIPVDKHSTGGVGDTTTLILAPLVAACGVSVAKMSGRGLGHTGGTLDKLESINGLSVSISEEAFLRQVSEIGLAVIGQTKNLAPADKTLYALRDVTSTVDSLPLIASSIISKKLASGAQAIVLDVKTGSGAMMKTPESSIELAEAMVRIACGAGRNAVAIVTDMNEPLGSHVGNALEVKEAIDVLSGRTDKSRELVHVSLELGARMLVLAEAAADVRSARAKLEAALASGAGLEKLRAMIKAQGGDSSCCDDVSKLPQANVKMDVPALSKGWIHHMDTVGLGNAAQLLGAGRLTKDDIIDPSVGFVLHKRIGCCVEQGESIATIFAKDEASAKQAVSSLQKCITISNQKAASPKLIHAFITVHGVERL